ncbi:uncharacterized protein J3R85_015112 [Psidium guajava]|nr:uncharacterized protein J3R85_015112 [Psidium guajava]
MGLALLARAFAYPESRRRHEFHLYLPVTSRTFGSPASSALNLAAAAVVPRGFSIRRGEGREREGKMQRSLSSLVRPARGFSTKSEKIVASVLFERLPVVIPKIDPVVYAFQEFSFRWRQQYRRRYPDEFLDKSNARGKGDYRLIMYQLLGSLKLTKQMTESLYKEHWTEDCIFFFMVMRMVLQLLILLGIFLKRFMNLRRTLRKCAESALESVLGDLSHTYFVGNAPMGHTVMQQTEDSVEVPSFKRFFFKSQVIATNKFNIRKCKDFVWVTKDELLEYFPEQAQFLNKMIIS